MNGAPNRTRTHLLKFADLACLPLTPPRRLDEAVTILDTFCLAVMQFFERNDFGHSYIYIYIYIGMVNMIRHIYLFDKSKLE